jgi:hypothetical protein
MTTMTGMTRRWAATRRRAGTARAGTKRTGTAAAALVLLAAAALGIMVAGTGTATAASYPKPVLDMPFQDPGALFSGNEFYAFTTGGGLRESWAASAAGPWTAPVDRLNHKAAIPSWLRAGKGFWGPDMAKVGPKRYVVYFSGQLAQKHDDNKPISDANPAPDARCVGTATSDSARGPFAISARPLVCFKGFGNPADSMSAHPGTRLRGQGVIDAAPATINGKPYLLYKTQATMAEGWRSTIRMVPLSASGTTTAGASRQIVAGVEQAGGFRDTVEGPSLVQHGSRLILFTAHGNFGTCQYSTTWYVSKTTSPWSWPTHPAGTLTNSGSTGGLCGPGGADVTASKVAGQDRIFLHGWVTKDKHGNPTTVPAKGSAGAVRVMYAGVLTFAADGTPTITFLAPAK